MTPDKRVEEMYQLVLSVAKPLYDPDSDHVDIAIFEEQLFRKLEPALTKYHQDLTSEVVRKIDGLPHSQAVLNPNPLSLGDVMISRDRVKNIIKSLGK